MGGSYSGTRCLYFQCRTLQPQVMHENSLDWHENRQVVKHEKLMRIFVVGWKPAGFSLLPSPNWITCKTQLRQEKLDSVYTASRLERAVVHCQWNVNVTFSAWWSCVHLALTCKVLLMVWISHHMMAQATHRDGYANCAPSPCSDCCV